MQNSLSLSVGISVFSLSLWVSFNDDLESMMPFPWLNKSGHCHIWYFLASVRTLFQKSSVLFLNSS